VSDLENTDSAFPAGADRGEYRQDVDMPTFRRSIRTAATAVAVAPIVLAAAPAVGAAPGGQAPMIPSDGPTPFFITHGGAGEATTSTNWSGYAATGGTYTSVSVTFAQPAIRCSFGDQYASFWVGLDGDGSNSVEQTGTEADCDDGDAEYSSWYELYPADPVNYHNTIDAGDEITETVAFSGTDTYTMTIKDATKGWTRTAKKRSGHHARASAEVIVEAPYNDGVLPLADFGTVKFTGAAIDGDPLVAAKVARITMASHSGKIKAQVSALSGGSFAASWKSR
jgi:Peptidase A4 family